MIGGKNLVQLKWTRLILFPKALTHQATHDCILMDCSVALGPRCRVSSSSRSRGGHHGLGQVRKSQNVSSVPDTLYL